MECYVVYLTSQSARIIFYVLVIELIYHAVLNKLALTWIYLQVVSRFARTLSHLHVNEVVYDACSQQCGEYYIYLQAKQLIYHVVFQQIGAISVCVQVK